MHGAIILLNHEIFYSSLAVWYEVGVSNGVGKVELNFSWSGNHDNLHLNWEIHFVVQYIQIMSKSTIQVFNTFYINV